MCCVQIICVAASILIFPLMWITKESSAEERLANSALAQHVQLKEFTVSSAAIIGASVPVQ